MRAGLPSVEDDPQAGRRSSAHLRCRRRWSSPLLMALVLTSCACSDGPGKGHLVSLTVEQESRRPVAVWTGETAGGAALILGPLCPERKRERFTWRRLAHRLGIEPGSAAGDGGQLAVLWVVNGPSAETARDVTLPADRPILRAEAVDPATGTRVEYADHPLGQKEAVRADPLLRALVVSGSSPRVVPAGKAARLLLWLPGARLESADTMRVVLADSEIRLRPGTVGREAWWAFEEDLDSARLVEGLSPRPAATGSRTAGDPAASTPGR